MRKQDEFQEVGGGKVNPSNNNQPENKVNWVQWAIIGLIVTIIALVVFL